MDSTCLGMVKFTHNLTLSYLLISRQENIQINSQILTQESDSCPHSDFIFSCSFKMCLLACTSSGYLALVVSFVGGGKALPSSPRLRLLDDGPFCSVSDGGG